ncbi:uncharacterized protein DUF1206 [Roseivirga ehrenbergii]|uniref:DUF1206 domain-containing protein n=1 Tax=Roseivirga ehrenbergii (strain DSM 102268 / JCM 13514 / KCTC 12282 / NCIMB 14502 / KMM 6017) TaxID=279360 RepID=A0A150X0Y6_ROSEK|nr:DUF1206 domain-containing protein [Roseivirga ehrenbergii]KYG72232.1 hypothetical protein MB14_09330 [Roseivirga ehrenbergii]TCL13471.1 uncharacterized protein DUF1206 [Roseivirga ehrenbergii]
MNTLEKLARFGIASKGFVYLLIGGLTAMTAFGIGGVKAGSTEAFQYISSNVIGKVILSLTAIGLFIYLIWTSTVAIKNPEEIDKDAQGWSTRFSYLSSGVFYGMLGFTAAKLVIFPLSDSGDSQLFTPLLNSKFGVIFLYFMSVVFLIKTIFQIYLVASGIYKKKINTSDIESKRQKTVLIKAGIIGFAARALVFAVITFLTLKGAISANPDEVDGTNEAFHFLEETFGTIILAVIAFGMIAFGFFVLLKAKYRRITLD